jgi:hypothetical protein
MDEIIETEPQVSDIEISHYNRKNNISELVTFYGIDKEIVDYIKDHKIGVTVMDDYTNSLQKDIFYFKIEKENEIIVYKRGQELNDLFKRAYEMMQNRENENESN